MTNVGPLVRLQWAKTWESNIFLTAPHGPTYMPLPLYVGRVVTSKKRVSNTLMG